ncbi:hypothetical protein Vadar_033076 [Vaccinium darrowii]|uniref:Uncharacterized protein n=1 Tax=Vaccinium darrowii TaxID=229202 RepID=A0ACB7ZNF9_9ERIC|nr:hypothetical protein Vadar_033076 [Vaccinium darrowii]
MIPRTISLWDQFSEHEAGAMRNLPGAFPIAIGFRLKITTNYGVALATRNSSTFILNPSIQEAIGLQAWCAKNATKIRELRAMPQGRPLVPKAAPPKREAIVSIASLPTSVEAPLLFGVEGVIEIVDYGQRIKFNVELTDATGTITAAIFADTAEEFYNITTDEMNANIVDDQLQWPMLERLTSQRECSANLKAYNYGYGGISQCRFNITSIFNRADDSFENDHGPPAKKEKIHHDKSGSSAGAPQANKSFNMATTGDNSEDDETNDLAKKND